MHQRFKAPTFPSRRSATGLAQRAEQRPERAAPQLSAAEESFLTGITTSGQFSLNKTLGMYASVRRLRDQKK